ncbi:hypothetical protein ACFQX6_41515 [Streptosporangium lutulentum]
MISRRSPTGTGHPGRQEYGSCLRVTRETSAENFGGPVGVGLAVVGSADGAGAGGADGETGAETDGEVSAEADGGASVVVDAAHAVPDRQRPPPRASSPGA